MDIIIVDFWSAKLNSTLSRKILDKSLSVSGVKSKTQIIRKFPEYERSGGAKEFN